MDFELSEEQRAMQHTARAFARAAMMPFARQWDEDEIFPVDTLREAAKLGFGGIYVAADVGGSALSRLDAVLIFEELAQGCPSTSAYVSIHNMVAWMVDAYGSSELRRRFLPELCSMAKFSSYCLTEPGSGSDAASLTTRAQRRDDHYVLDGTKAFISGGAHLCLERTIADMKERKQFGSRLADFQALGFRVADYATELEASRLMLYRAADALDRREGSATRLAAMAKRLATDTGFAVVNG